MYANIPCMRAVLETVQRVVMNEGRTGKRARAEREQEGFSLRSLARAMKISAAYLSDLEKGKRNWSLKLVDAFNLAVKEMKAAKKGKGND